MKVCFVLPKIIASKSGAIVGGSTNCAISLALSLSKKVDVLHIVTHITDEERSRLIRHPVYPFLKSVKGKNGKMLVRGIRGLLCLMKEIGRLHHENDYDVIHLHSGSYLYALALNRSVLHGTTVVHSIYCPIVSDNQNALANCLARLLCKAISNNADVRVGVTQNICHSIIKVGLPRRKMVFLPMGVNIHNFTGEPNLKHKDAFVYHGSSRLLFIGNTSLDKGLFELIDALAILKKSRIKFQLVVTLENQSGRSELSHRREIIGDKIKALNLGKDIRFLGLVPEIADLIKEADILVFPFQEFAGLKGVSDYPMALLESMACEKCVVATPFGGVPEILEDGINGVICESFKPDSIAKALLYIINKPQVRVEIGKAARKTIVDRYSTDIIACNLIDLYNAFITKKGPVHAHY
jgi:glycosyltransferase involved in cell wall biosynthesis